MKKRALLLSGYHAASHARWARGLCETLTEYDWTELNLPPRHFKWRLRGNAWWWALEEPILTERFDLIVATSMVDLAALIGLLPHLGTAHKVVYFHENQFDYPTQDDEFDIHLGLSNIYTALAADIVVFNSEYNRRTLLQGVRDLCQRLPDFAPKSTADRIESASCVVPVGLEDAWYQASQTRSGPMQIVWNHRWEYDKAPERFFAALRLLAERGVEFQAHVVGQQFRQVPEAFETAREELGDRIVTWGFVPDVGDYRGLLGRCDVVVSTALHEFQGLAVLEACAAGCTPVVPERLAYPEFVPDHCLYASHVSAPEREARKLAKHLAAVASRLPELRASPAVSVDDLRWSALAERYRATTTSSHVS